MHSLENEVLKIWVKPKGAELKSLTQKKTGTEYIWNADPDFWGKSSPVLFPFVGGLKDDTYSFEGKSYEMGRHGFARDRMFALESKTETSLTFLLKSDADSLAVYPFHFELRLTYTLEGSTLTVTYEVKNLGSDKMYFSIGAHPAFSVPLDVDAQYKDYSLSFSAKENAERWLLSDEGLLTGETESLGEGLEKLPLSKGLFEKDALVFKGLKSNEIRLQSDEPSPGLAFGFNDFPYFGIWAAPNADFVCLEPWCGIADSVDHNQELTSKEGINTLAASEAFQRSWSVEVF